MSEKPDIKSLTHMELEELALSYGQPKFRVKQIEQWLYQKGAQSFDQMSNLSADLRSKLDADYSLNIPSIELKQMSKDGTRKYLFKFADGICVETVGIPSSDKTRLTVCFSTQAGCAMGCTFCATGNAGFTRNLNLGEMYDQVRLVGEDFGQRVSNVVAMGQGEPFSNYSASMQAIGLMNSPMGLGIGARHITVSTCGIVKGIQRFSREPEQYTLAVSLHSAVQKTRDQIMPGVSSNKLSELREEIKAYGDTTKRRPTLEYAPMDGINDDDEHLNALIDFCKGMLCHVNLIPLNPIEDMHDNPCAMAPSKRINTFQRVLTQHGIEVSIRDSRGSDIDGACGQLRQRHLGI